LNIKLKQLNQEEASVKMELFGLIGGLSWESANEF
jgi:hypothetical protein